jgi:hypothetical protein
MEETFILIDGDGNFIGTASNPLYCQVASPEEDE